MKLKNITKLLVAALLAANTHAMQAENTWAMATIDDATTSFTLFHGMPEQAPNGIEYLRIYDESFKVYLTFYDPRDYAPEKLPYGYRMSDKQIFIYDFDIDKERLAFDFRLSAGEHFQTYNGVEWEIEAVIDTIVNTSYLGQGEKCTKRLMKVRSVDGRYTDQWLEDFGSFANHFMILPMSSTGQTQTLWMEYDYGYYFVREISSDPFYAHDYGVHKDTLDPVDDYEDVKCTYKDGILVVEEERWHSPNREYTCFYRIGDDFYCAYVWELNPGTEIDIALFYKDTVYYTGVPAPQSGEYTMHLYPENKPDDPLSIKDIVNVNDNKQTESAYFDLNGCKTNGKPQQKGIHIIRYSDGTVKKVFTR